VRSATGNQGVDSQVFSHDRYSLELPVVQSRKRSRIRSGRQTPLDLCGAHVRHRERSRNGSEETERKRCTLGRHAPYHVTTFGCHDDCERSERSRACEGSGFGEGPTKREGSRRLKPCRSARSPTRSSPVHGRSRSEEARAGDMVCAVGGDTPGGDSASGFTRSTLQSDVAFGRERHAHLRVDRAGGFGAAERAVGDGGRAKVRCEAADAPRASASGG